MRSWEADLAEVRARYAALGQSDVASAVEHACEWRLADPFSGFFLPLPPVAQELFSAHGNWRTSDDAPYERPDSVALDASGRPVAHVLERGGDFERAKHLWWWDEDGSLLEVELMGGGPHVRRARALDGRLAHIATVSAGIEETVQILTSRDGRAVRSHAASVSAYGGWARARTAEFDADGALLRIREVRERGSSDLEACLEQAAALDPEELLWDARVHAPEPWPGDAAALARAAPLAVALDRALRAATADSDVAGPFLLEVFTVEDRNSLFPPVARLHGAQWRDRMRRSSSHHGAALFETHKAAEAGLAPDMRLVDRLDEEALHTCRMLSSAYHAGSPRSLLDAADPVADVIGDELTRSLNATPLPGAVDPFLAAVFIGARHRTGDRFDRIRTIVGEQRFERFLASVRSTKPRGGAARKLREQARRALTDCDALEALLADGGLPAHAARLAHQIAEPGLLLRPAGDKPVRSRLGGPPLLPAGEPWPGRLTFVAGIDLAELPPAALPAQGWLLFFVDFGTGEADGLLDEAPNEPGSTARLFWTENAVAATGPSLNPRPVTALRFLTLPDDWTAGQLLGLDVYDRETYAELAERLEAALPASDSRHWLGGHATGVQGAPLDYDTALLLSIEYDGDLGFSFLDGGTVQFRIPPDALAQHDFSRVIAFGDSC